MQLRGAGLPGRISTLQAAPDLGPVASWTTIGSAAADTAGTFLFTDSQAGGCARRVSRAVEP